MKTQQEPNLRGQVLARASASAPGTCGELAQGLLNETLVMVTFPIDLFSTATVEVTRGAGVVYGPVDSPKATKAVALALRHLGHRDLDAWLRLDSPIPRQKGMASSTADIVSSMAATAAAVDAPLSVRRQAELALQIEPSDGIMLPGVALFAHRSGRIARSLGDPPPMRVLVLEFSHRVDTEAFNSVDRRAALESQSAPFLEALHLIAAGIEKGDGRLIGRGATLNALAYQEVFPNPHWEAAVELAKATGAEGANVAHSGTVVGLLYGRDQSQIARAIHQARRNIPGLIGVHHHRLIGGGITAVGTERLG